MQGIQCEPDDGRERNEELDGFRSEAVEIPVTDTLDLHSFLPAEIRSVAIGYLEEAARLGFRQVRLIHGRGTGTQRELIRSMLATLSWVSDFHDADPSGGGWGATVVLLREPAGEMQPAAIESGRT